MALRSEVTDAPAVRRLLVPMDGSSTSLAALHVAAALVGPLGGVAVDVVDCVSAPWPPEWERDWIAVKAKEAGVSVDVTTAVRASDDVVEEILAASAEPGTTICIGSHGRSPLGELAFGSTTHSLLERSTTPVLVVGPAAAVPATFDVVQIASDGTDTSEAAAAAAGAWCRQLGATAWLTEVVEGEPAVPDGSPDVLEGAASHRTASDLEHLGVAASWEVLHGPDAARSLLEWARERHPTLLAAGTTAAPAARRLIVGSVATRLVAAAPCPVLLAGPLVAPDVLDRFRGSRPARRG